MNIDWNIAAPIVSPIIALVIAAILNHLFARRPRLIAYYGHVAAFTAWSGTENEVILHTHEIVVRNAGRRPAKNVRLGHAELPQFQVNPAVAYSVQDLPGGGQEILFPLLVPGEQITVSYLYFPPTIYSQINTSLKSDEGFGKVLNVLLTIQYPTWFNHTVLMLIALGIGSLFYLIIILLIWLF
ncbi:MAG: hypothetical protein V3T84_06600 [Phycisphaerales bacterium]